MRVSCPTDTLMQETLKHVSYNNYTQKTCYGFLACARHQAIIQCIYAFKKLII